VADGWCWFVLIEKYCWLVAGGWFVVRERYCWLVAGGWFVLREKYCWLVADKPNEQGVSIITGWESAKSDVEERRERRREKKAGALAG
jgi:hypothetical protein